MLTAFFAECCFWGSYFSAELSATSIPPLIFAGESPVLRFAADKSLAKEGGRTQILSFWRLIPRWEGDKTFSLKVLDDVGGSPTHV